MIQFMLVALLALAVDPAVVHVKDSDVVQLVSAASEGVACDSDSDCAGEAICVDSYCTSPQIRFPEIEFDFCEFDEDCDDEGFLGECDMYGFCYE